MNRVMLIFAFFLFMFSSAKSSAKPPTKHSLVGVYYFDGWQNDYHLTKSLLDSFPDRKPIWGWHTSTKEAVDAQINLAANAGISFFNFCWYYPQGWSDNYKDHPLNNALKLYLQSTNKKKLKFSLLVANHAGFEIGPADWLKLCNSWINYFKDKRYVTIDKKPYITFFDLQSLVNNFGSPQAVKKALNDFRALGVHNGLRGITIAVNVYPVAESVNTAKACGFDALTGYNYPDCGNLSKSEKANLNVPIDKLTSGQLKMWNSFIPFKMPYIPVATLNWDPRPWESFSSSYKNSIYYTTYSYLSVKKSVEAIKRWVYQNPTLSLAHTPVFILYAWNEYGEGAWLTPSIAKKNSLLKGVQQGLKY